MLKEEKNAIIKEYAQHEGCLLYTSDAADDAMNV